MSKYQPVIGLEIHVELSTKSKMFCQCDANYFQKKPNSNTCPVCLALPGALPVPNKKAIEWTIKIGQALGCRINTISKFDRKHYFYPDLPKGYQISQYDEPIAIKGVLNIKGQGENEKSFKITRVHLEEDTGKLIHAGEETLVDFNRSGVPLVEIVTEPDFDNSTAVKRFLEELQVIIRYLGVSDADMEKGSMRLEPNISLRKVGENGLPNYKVEVKNINSFKYVQKAIEYELKRQEEILEKGETPAQETRGFNENKGITFSQRSKEEAHDYRYFPEPDIPPLTFESKYIEKLRSEMPELPQKKMERYIEIFKVKEQDAFILTRSIKTSEYFEQIISKVKSQKSKLQLKSQNLEQFVANLIVNKKIPVDASSEEFIDKAVNMSTVKQTDKGALKQAIDNVVNAHAQAVTDYKNGKESAIMFLVGQVMKEMKGQADPTLVKKLLIALLTN